MSWKAGGDGKPVAIPSLPWHDLPKDYCPALKEPCNCSQGGTPRAFCRGIADAKEK
jgi:hypothetical protein